MAIEDDNNKKYDDELKDETDLSGVAWKLAQSTEPTDDETLRGVIETINETRETPVSRATMYRRLAILKGLIEKYKAIIEEQQKMSLKLGLDASDKLADKFTTHEYEVVKDRLYNLTRGRFLEPWEVDISKIVPDDQCPVPDAVDSDDDPRDQIWQDINNPHYDSNIDPDYDDKKHINEAELSGIDEVLANFEKMRKAERDSIPKADIDAVLTHFEKLRTGKNNKIYNDFINDFSPYYHW